MLCSTCLDSGLRGWILIAVGDDGVKTLALCPDCEGSGLQYCCEGDQATPERPEETQ